MSIVTVHQADTPWHLAILEPEGRKAAELLSTSGMIPQAYSGKPVQIQLAIAMGARVGLDWLASLNGICVINNRATIWGDAALAICRSRSVFEDIEETNNGKEGREFVATCTVMRRDCKPTVRTFSMVDAVVAGLDKKADTWGKYPKRMCQMRARAYALRDAFADVLMGFPLAEEMRDVEGEVVGTTIGEGVDLSQPAPPAKKRGRPPGAAKDEAPAADKPADVPAAPAATSDPGKLPEPGAPTPTDPGQKTIGEHVTDAQHEADMEEGRKRAAANVAASPPRYGRDQAKALLQELFADLATRPAVTAANAAMGKKLSECADGDEVHRFFVILSGEADKLKAGKS
jgi:hypothetical protein